MEFVDASNEEASSYDPPETDLSNNRCLEAISMLLMTPMADCLKRGSVMAVAERFHMACSMIHRRKWAEHMCAMGIINSPELYSQGGNPGRVPKYLPDLIEEGVKGILLRKRHNQQKLAKLMGVSKTTVHHWFVESTLCVHSNSLRPLLTEENRLARFEMAMDARDPVDQTKYQDMHD